MRTSKKEHVLRSAMTIVEKQGLAALTYESLAAESGLSKSGLIYYFPSRQTLLLEINRFLAAQWEEKNGGTSGRARTRGRQAGTNPRKFPGHVAIRHPGGLTHDPGRRRQPGNAPTLARRHGPMEHLTGRLRPLPATNHRGRPMGPRPYQRVLPLTSAAATIHSASTHVVSPRSWVKCLS